MSLSIDEAIRSIGAGTLPGDVGLAGVLARIGKGAGIAGVADPAGGVLAGFGATARPPASRSRSDGPMGLN
jgi:hypothetical protein